VQILIDEMFRYVEMNNVAFYVYREFDFPLLSKISEEFANSFNDNKVTKAYVVKKFKTYKLNDKLVMFNILLNDQNVYDVTYRYEDINNFLDTQYRRCEVMQVVLNCHYTQYHEYIKAVINEIKGYVALKQSNRRDGMSLL